MNELFKHLGAGEFPSSREYNRLVDAVMALLNSTNVQYFTDSRGIHTRRMPVIEATQLHNAFAKAAAGAGSTIVCYLDSDSHDVDDEITVAISIVGGVNLNSALPRLTDGALLTVWDDEGTWRNAGNPFQDESLIEDLIDDAFSGLFDMCA